MSERTISVEVDLATMEDMVLQQLKTNEGASGKGVAAAIEDGIWGDMPVTVVLRRSLPDEEARLRLTWACGWQPDAENSDGL